MVYKTCPECGANLDPGERCDCESVDSKTEASGDVQITFNIPEDVKEASAPVRWHGVEV